MEFEGKRGTVRANGKSVGVCCVVFRASWLAGWTAGALITMKRGHSYILWAHLQYVLCQGRGLQ